MRNIHYGKCTWVWAFLIVLLGIINVHPVRAYASQGDSAQCTLPDWPEEFGQPRDIIRAHRWPGYKAVMGPDSAIWCFTLGESSETADRESFILTRVGKDMSVMETLEIEHLQGDVISFDVGVGEDYAILFWAEKRGDEYYLLAKQIKIDCNNPEGALNVSDEWHFLIVGSVVADVSVSISGDQIFLGWVDQEEGRPGVFIAQLDANVFQAQPGTGEVESHMGTRRLERVRLSPPDVSVTSLEIVPAPGGIWALWVEAGQILNRVVLTSYIDGTLGSRIQVTETTSRDTDEVAPLISDDGLCHLVFTQGKIVKGTLTRQVLVYGIIDREGLWIMEPIDITQGEGNVASPYAVFANDEIFIAWADNRHGKFQIYYSHLKVSTIGSEQLLETRAVSSGAATLSTKECFSPYLFVFEDGTKGILYKVYLEEGDIMVRGVSSLNPKDPSCAYYLGLDLENPFGDGLFKLFNAIISAGAITFLAIPSLSVGLIATLFADRLHIFSGTTAGAVLRLLFLFGVIFLLKMPDVWFYLFAPVLPQGLSWLSFGVASAATLCIHILCTSHAKDVVATASAGVLFMFFDNLFSVIVKGVGLF